jgi:uncharacterized protein
MEIAYPFHIDEAHQQVANTAPDEHIRQMIEQLLFTSPGERVNRPTFGTSLMQLVFAPNSDELTTAVQFLVQSSLQQWLGELIQVEAVQIESEEANLLVTVQYVIRRDRQRQVAQFVRGEL